MVHSGIAGGGRLRRFHWARFDSPFGCQGMHFQVFARQWTTVLLASSKRRSTPAAEQFAQTCRTQLAG